MLLHCASEIKMSKNMILVQYHVQKKQGISMVLSKKGTKLVWYLVVITWYFHHTLLAWYILVLFCYLDKSEGSLLETEFAFPIEGKLRT